MGYRLDLTSDDLKQATTFCENFRKLKPKPIRSHATVVEEDWQFAGKLAEIAVGKVTNLPVNFEVFEHADAGDFTLHDSRTLSVRGVQVLKRMDYPFKLIIREGEIKTDLVCLVLISPKKDYAVIEGYIEAENFFKKAKVEKQWSHQGPSEPFTLTKTMLKPFEELLK